jgi:hypothetical protein
MDTVAVELMCVREQHMSLSGMCGSSFPGRKEGRKYTHGKLSRLLNVNKDNVGNTLNLNKDYYGGTDPEDCHLALGRWHERIGGNYVLSR